MGVQGKQEKHKFRGIVDSWKKNLSPTEYELVRTGLKIGLPVLLVLLVAGILLFKEDHNEFRTLVLSLAALIGLPLLVWRGVSLDRSSKAAEKQAENASKSHVADTYTKAIEQLGAVDSKGEPRLELRLGGLYALEKIAKSNEDYHPQIMEVLCAYVRMHCQTVFDPEEDDSEQHFKPLGIDARACLTVIDRRTISFDTGNILNLSSIDMNRFDLTSVKLKGLNLSNAKLSNTNLRGAELYGAHLYGADFKEADISWADLGEANLEKANLEGANLSRAILKGVKGLTCEQIKFAKIDRDTILPDYIKVTWADDGSYTCEMVEDSN